MPNSFMNTSIVD